MTTRPQEVVAALERALVHRIGEPRYNLWFGRNTKFRWEDDLLVVGVPNHFYQDWLQTTFADAVCAAASEVTGRAMRARFVIDAELFQAARRAQEEADGTARGQVQAPTKAVEPGQEREAAEENSVEAPRFPAVVSPRRRNWHHLKDFVVGACNRVAHASALHVVESPGDEVNPLVLHGPVGTGKTCLLEGIYVGLRKRHPEWSVCFTSAEDFTNRFVQAMRLGKIGAFRKHFRDCEALLVDDLQFFAGKKATQEEFLHTLDALLNDGRQLVVSTDCHPRLTDDWPVELTDRLLGGAVWGLMPPDADTRLALLRAKAASCEQLVPEAVLRFVGEQVRGNVRELEGALHSLQHFARVTGKAIDLQLAREALSERLRHTTRVVQLADVDGAVCRVLRLGSGTLQAKARTWAVSHPRMLAIFLARKHTTAAYSEIGQFFGGRNHSTAVAAEKKVRLWLRDDGDLLLGERRLRVRELIEQIERELTR